MACNFCQGEHRAADCTENRIFAGMTFEDINPEEAWKQLEQADKEKDVDDIKKVSWISSPWAYARS